MEGTSGPGDEGPPPDKGQPPPPPSPLSGAYLLIIVGEPHSEAHKEDILRKIANGFKSWDPECCHVSLDKEIQNIISQAPEGEEARHGERLIQFASENLVTEVLIQPQLNTLIQCVRNLLSSFTKHRHLVHAGYTFASNGSWIVQDGTFSLADLIDAFLENDVLRVLRAYENSVTVDIHCAPEGEWSTARMRKESFSKLCRVRVNPDDCPTPAGNIQDFINYISPFLRPTSLEQLLEPSDVVGNIRFSHPTLYVFPGGQGDAALFGINGFNMLVDGGFARKACFWDFTRHLDRLDAVLMTRVNNSNVNGLSAVLRRKKINHVYPQIGHFFCNVQERRQPLTPDADKVRDPLSINLLDEGQEILQNLSHLQLKPHSCYRDNVTEPINLYHKVGHGKLDMYILSPSKDSKELKEFLSKWSSHDSSLFSSSSKKFGDKEFSFPIQNLVSICALLVWQPANPSDTITRILFPGSTPQHKIFEGLDKLKHLEFMKHPVCSAKTLTPSSSNIGINAKFNKQKTTPAVIDKLLPGEQVQKVPKSIPSVESVNKQNIAKSATIPVSGSIIDTKPKTHTSRAKLKTEKTRTEKTEVDKTIESETKVDKHSPPPEIVKKTDKIKDKPKKTESKIPPKIDKKTTKVTPTEKKTDSVKSSPTTPKKIIENKLEKVNGVATKSEISKASVTRASNKTKASPSSTPAKSAKEENNRKVVESKHKVSVPSRPPTGKTIKKEETKPKVERKVAKKTTTASPTKAVLKQSSPAKTITKTTTKKKEVKKVKSEVEKGVVTDSSAVSTPSTVDAEMTVLKETKTEEKITEHVKDDKENIIDEKEKQIEEDVSKDIDEGVEIKDKEESLTEDIAEEEKIAKDIKEEEPDSLIGEKESEKEEEDEILIIEKVEVEQYGDDSIQDQESIESHIPDEVEDEIQKHMRDEAESEKKEKHLEEAKEEVKKAEEIQKEELETEEVVKDLEIKGVTKPTADLKLKLVSTLTTDRLTPENKEQIFEEVQDIILSATEIAKSKLETAKDSSDISAEGFGSDEQRTSGDTKDMLSSGDKLNIVSDKNLIESTEDENKLDDTRDKSKDLGDVRYGAEESQPDEKFSTTVESGATTAPTLPEDERIPLDEIKEGIEEKYIKEDTKEKDIGVPTKLEQPTSLPQVAVIGGVGFETRGVHVQLRDIVKTPDEVADLPVHEEVDGVYEDDEFGRDIHRSKEDLLDVTPHKEKDQDKQVAVKTEEKEPEEIKANIAETEIGHIKADEDELKELKMIRQKLEEDDVEYKPTSGLLTKDKEEKVDISSEMKRKDDKGIKKPTEEIMEAEKLIDLQSRGSSERFERDSYELYTDSGVEEELVHGILKAPEVPELVTVPTDSAPESPHHEVDKIKTKEIEESKTELDEDIEQDIKDTTDFIETQDTTTPEKVENEISITPVVETKDKQEITKEKDLHVADMVDKEHATFEDTIEKIDDVKQVDIETSLEKVKEEITPTELTSSSADLPAKDTDIEEPIREIPTKEEMSEVGKIVSDLQEDKLKTQSALKDESISSEKHEEERLESKEEDMASFEVEKKEMEHEIQLISDQDMPNLANEIITKISPDVTESTIPPQAEISGIEKDIEAKSMSAVLSDKDDITSLEKEKTLKIPPISEKEELEITSDITAQIDSESEKKDIEKLICSESTEPNKLEDEHLHSDIKSKSASPVPSEKYEPLKEEESPKRLLQTEKHELMDEITKDDLSKDVSPTPLLKDEHAELQDKDLTSKSISPDISEKDEAKLTIVEKDSFKSISLVPSEKVEPKLPDGVKYSPKSTSPVPSEKDELKLIAVEKHSPKSASPVPSEKDESKLTPTEKDSSKSSSPVPSEKDESKLTAIEKDSPKSASPVPSEKDEPILKFVEKDIHKSASPIPSEKDEPTLTSEEKDISKSASPVPSEKDEPIWTAVEKDISKGTSPVTSKKDEVKLTAEGKDISKSASPVPSEKEEPTWTAVENEISISCSQVPSEKDEPKLTAAEKDSPIISEKDELILTAIEKDISKSTSSVPSKDEKLTTIEKDSPKSASPVPSEKEEPTMTVVEKDSTRSPSPVPSKIEEPKLTSVEKDSPKTTSPVPSEKDEAKLTAVEKDSPIISEKDELILTAIEKDISKSTSSVPSEKDEKLTTIEKDSPKSASPVPSEKEEPTMTVVEKDSTRSPSPVPSKIEEPKLTSVEKDSPKTTSPVPSEKDEPKLTAVEKDTAKSTSSLVPSEKDEPKLTHEEKDSSKSTSPVPSEKDEPKLTAVGKHSLQSASPVPSEKDELELAAIEKYISKSTSPVPSEREEPKLTAVENDSTKSASPVPPEKEEPKLTTADKDSPKSASPVPSERDEPKLTVVEKDSTKSASPVPSEKEEPKLTDATKYSPKSISPVPSEKEEYKLTAAEKDSPKSTSPVALEKDEPTLTTVEKDISTSASPVPSEKDETTFTAVEKEISKGASPVPSEKDESKLPAVEKDSPKSASPVPSKTDESRFVTTAKDSPKSASPVLSEKDESKLLAVEKDSPKSASPVPSETDESRFVTLAKDSPKSTSPIPSERDELKFLTEEKDISKSDSPVLSEKDEPKLTVLEKSSPKTTSPVPFEKYEPTLTAVEKDISKSVSPIASDKVEPKLTAAEKEIAKSISPVPYEKDESKMTVVEKDSPKSTSPVPSEKEEGNVPSVEKSSLKSVSPSPSEMDERKLSTEKDDFKSISPVPSEKDEHKLLVTDKESPKSASPVLSEKGETKLLANDKEESYKIVSLPSSDKEEAQLTTEEKDSSKSASPVPSEIHERKLSATEKDDLSLVPSFKDEPTLSATDKDSPKGISPVPSEKEGKLPTLENISPKSVSPTPSEIINERKLSTTENETHKSTSPILSYKDESKSTGVEKDILNDASPVPSEKDETKLPTAGKESPKSVSPVPSEKDEPTLSVTDNESIKGVSPVPSEKEVKLSTTEKESSKSVSPALAEMDDRKLSLTENYNLKSNSPVPSEKDEPRMSISDKDSISPVLSEKDESKVSMTEKYSPKSSALPDERKQSLTEKEFLKGVSPIPTEKDESNQSSTGKDSPKSLSPEPKEILEYKKYTTEKDDFKSISPVPSEKEESKPTTAGKDSPKSISPLPSELDEQKLSTTEKDHLKGVSPVPSEKEESQLTTTAKDSPKSISPLPSELDERKLSTSEKDHLKGISPVPSEKEESKSTTTGKDSPKSISPLPSELDEQKLSTLEKDHLKGVSQVPSEKEESKPTFGKDSPKSISPLPSELEEQKLSTSEKDHLKGVSPVPSEKEESKPTFGKDSPKSISPLPSELEEQKLLTSEKDHLKGVSPVPSEKEESKPTTAGKDSQKSISPLPSELDERKLSTSEKDHLKGVSPVSSEKEESKPTTAGKDSPKSISPSPSELDEQKLSTEKDSQKDVSPVSSEKEESKLSTSEKGSHISISPLGFEIDEQHSTIQEKDIISKNIEMDKDSASFKDQSLDLSINNQILADKHSEVPSKTNDLQSDISPNGFSSISSGKYELQAKIDHDLIPKSISPVPFEPEYLRVDKLDGYEPPKSPSPVGSEKKKNKQPVEEKESTHKSSNQIFSDNVKLREYDFLTSEKDQVKSSEELLQEREIETHKDEKGAIVDKFHQEEIKTTEKEISTSKKYNLKSEDLNDTVEEIEKDSSKITFHESEILEKSTTDKEVSKLKDHSLLQQTEDSIFTPGKTDVKEILLDKSLDRKLSDKENLEKVISSEDYIIKSSLSKMDALLQKSSTTDSPDIQEKHDSSQLSSSPARIESQYLKEETFESSKLSLSGSPQQLSEYSQDFSSTKSDLSSEHLDKEVEKTLHTIREKEDTFALITEKIDITDKQKHKDESKEQEIIERNLTYSEFTESKQESYKHSLTYSDKQESQKEKESEISKIEVISRLSLEKDDLDSKSRQLPDTPSMQDSVTEEQLTVEESKIVIETKKDDKLKDFTKHSETSQISLVDKKELKQEDLNAITKISETITTSDETKESTTIHETTTSRLKEIKHDEIEKTGIVKESFENISSKFTEKEETLNKTSIDLAEHEQKTSFTDTKTELVNGKSYEGFQSTIDNELAPESSTAKSERISEETTVRRMVVTATSEDGGLETELCTETNQFDETISSETKLDKTKQSQIYEIPCTESVIKSVTTVYKQGTHEDDNTTRTTEIKEKEHTKYEIPSKENTTKSETTVHEDGHDDSKITTRIIRTETKLGETKTVQIEYEIPSQEYTTKSETVYTHDAEHEDGKSVTTTRTIQSESEYKEYDIPSKESIKTTLYTEDDKHIGETTNVISSETKLGETKETKHEIPSKESTTKIETTVHHDDKHDIDKTFTTTKTIYGEDNSKTILTTVKKVTTTELPTIKQEIKIIKDDMPASAISILRKEISEVRSGTPGSDFTSERDYELGGPSTPHSDISSGQVSRAATNVWSRHGDSDDDVPCSPMSATSHVAHSPLQFDFDVHRTPESSYYEETPKVKETKISSAMTSSLYGGLPQEDPSEEQKGMDMSMYSSMYVSKYDDESDHEEYNVKGKFESMFKGEDVDYQTALMEHRTTRGEDISKYTNGKSENGKSNVNGKSYMEYQEGIGEKVNGKSSTSMFKEYTSASSSSANQKFIPGQPFETSSGFFEKEDEKKKDPIESWGKPLGLPPPPPLQRLDSPISPNSFELIWNPEEEWGEPLGLPSPAPPPVKKDSLDGDNDLTPNSNKTTPKKMAKKSVENNKTASNISAGKEVSNKPKRSESPVKRMSNKDSRTNKPVVPMYMDLTYVPHHGNSHYTSVEFFKRVRARYYVFSGTEPSRDVFNALLEAKQTWEDKDLEVTIIPTYDTDTLGYWVAENEEILAKYKIDLSPSASRCTINLQDHDTSCSAYRLEF